MQYSEMNVIYGSTMNAVMQRVECQGPMPTKLKRISVALDSDVYQKLEQAASDSKRSVANLAALLIENALYPGGRVASPKEDNRGGKREGAGRKPVKSQDDVDAIDSLPETATDMTDVNAIEGEN